MDERHSSQREAIDRLREMAPGAPFLALGQTVFWDEPVKGLLAGLDSGRRFVAGIHDTDYFAKLPGSSENGGDYDLLPHNDTTTRGFWSAAGEFSALFGAEVVPTRDLLTQHGAKVSRLAQERPGLLDEVTEAWRWRGVVSRDKRDRTVSEMGTGAVVDALYKGFDWALDESLKVISGCQEEQSRPVADAYRAAYCEKAGSVERLGEFLESLLPKMYLQCSGIAANLETTRTTELLRFNSETCDLPRFQILDLFLRPESSDAAKESYNSALQGSDAYTLDRFGTGAIPFDVLLPGHGRGTLRLGNRGGVIMFPTPVGFRLEETVRSVRDLALLLEGRFGPDCVIVGKAVSLIGMLAREFVFVFHEGASSYVSRSRKMHMEMAAKGISLELNPILRIEYRPWDALKETCAWFVLPEPLRTAFGCKEISGPSFAARWRSVVESHEELLLRLKDLRRPTELIAYLQEEEGGAWGRLAEEFESTKLVLEGLSELIADFRKKKAKARQRQQELAKARIDAERRSGEHWRKHLFEVDAPDSKEFERREHLKREVELAKDAIREAEENWESLKREQAAAVSSEAITRARSRRRDIALEAEIERVNLIRRAIIVTEGLKQAGHRPSSWWFQLVSPEGDWYRATSKGARFRLEPLT